MALTDLTIRRPGLYRNSCVASISPDSSSATPESLYPVPRQRSQPTLPQLTTQTSPSELPIKEVPGDYGLPFFGALKDKLDYYWFQKIPQFYETRRDKYKSTVYKTNIAPGPPFFPDSKCIVLLDQKSFPVLFDLTRVDKTDMLVGNWRPSLDYWGGHRVLAYLDPSEEKHERLKAFCLEMVKSSVPRITPEFRTFTNRLFSGWDQKLQTAGEVNYKDDMSSNIFRFVITAFTGRDPSAAGKCSLGDSGATDAAIWTLPQIVPGVVVPVSWFLAPLVEALAHTFPLPPLLVKLPYQRLVNFFEMYSTDLLDKAEKQFQLDRDEALHNLIYFSCFNAYGGLNLLFPAMVGLIGSLSPGIQLELATEVRAAVKKSGGLTLKSLDEMPLVRSTVYEVMRFQPVVPNQFGRAKQDMIVESHDAAFLVKKGELMGGYLRTIQRDPRVFDSPDSFMPKRFLGEDGEKLVQYILWSNERETNESTVHNKACGGKSLVIPLAQMFLASLFQRYDSIELNRGNVLTTLKPASF